MGGNMKRKALVLALVLAVVAGSNAFAYKAAIGGEFGLNVGAGLPSSALLSFRLPQFPAVFGLGLTVGSTTASAALLADWWLWQGNLVSFINLYVGPGGYVSIGKDTFNLGLRIPVGFNAYPIKPLELFLELAPSMALIAPEGVKIPNFSIQAGFGFRFWF
jgi:hypothetical protein